MRLDGLPEPIACPECGEEMRYVSITDEFTHPGPCPVHVFAEHVGEGDRALKGHVPATRIRWRQQPYTFYLRSDSMTVWIPLEYA